MFVQEKFQECMGTLSSILRSALSSEAVQRPKWPKTEWNNITSQFKCPNSFMLNGATINLSACSMNIKEIEVMKNHRPICHCHFFRRRSIGPLPSCSFQAVVSSDARGRHDSGVRRLSGLLLLRLPLPRILHPLPHLRDLISCPTWSLRTDRLSWERGTSCLCSVHSAKWPQSW